MAPGDQTRLIRPPEVDATNPSRIALVLFVVAMGGSIASAQAPPVPSEPLLGHGHLWLKMGRTNIDDAAADAWGVDHEGYVALEGYGAVGGEFYLGGELGQVGVGSTIDDSGETLRDFHLYWGELNGKYAVDLTHGFTFDAGLGSALFYVQGEEVSTLSGEEFTDPLASFGFGAQVFFDFTWRARHLLLGLDAKYQWAFDFVDIDYSNLRYGGHLGFTF